MLGVVPRWQRWGTSPFVTEESHTLSVRNRLLTRLLQSKELETSKSKDTFQVPAYAPPTV